MSMNNPTDEVDASRIRIGLQAIQAPRGCVYCFRFGDLKPGERYVLERADMEKAYHSLDTEMQEVTESARAHSYISEKRLQKTCSFWLLMVWLLTFWLLTVPSAPR